MHRITSRLILFCMAFLLFAASDVYAWGSKTLVTINESKFTTEDFEHWWLYWNNTKEMPLPDNPEDFVDFHLMAQQGKDMEFDKTPSFNRKVEVFLKVRAMSLLKYDEVDSKVDVTEKEIKKYYEEMWTPKWSIQILAYTDIENAKKAYEKVLPFNGHAAGKLIFADLQGVRGDDGGPLNYEEAKIYPASLKPEGFKGWLEKLKKSKAHDIIEPFVKADNQDIVVLIRVDSVEMPPENIFDENKDRIEHQLNKAERGKLTYELVEKLKKKYKIVIDEELVKELKINDEYSRDFLEKKVVTGEGLDITVELLVHNCRKSARNRSSFKDEDLKKFILNSLISQSLIDLEGLNRGYEKEPPLKWGYEFYKQNRLRGAIENDLREKVSVSEDEILEYYDSNLSEFSTPEQVVYEIIEGDEESIKKMWTGILTGSKFSAIAEKYSKTASFMNVDINAVPAELRAEIGKLVKGEVSKPISIGSSYALVNLLDRVPSSTNPLKEVREKVVEMAKKAKFSEAKKEYLQQLRSLSTIKVNTDVWEKMVRESKNENE